MQREGERNEKLDVCGKTVLKTKKSLNTVLKKALVRGKTEVSGAWAVTTGPRQREPNVASQACAPGPPVAAPFCDCAQPVDPRCTAS